MNSIILYTFLIFPAYNSYDYNYIRNIIIDILNIDVDFK